MKKQIIVALIIGIIFIGGLMFFVNRNVLAKDKVTWEYDVAFMNLSDQEPRAEINKKGNEGWELVAIQQPSREGMGYYYIFKRAK